MAIRKQKLSHRINGQSVNHAVAMTGAHPTGGPDTVYSAPLALVTVQPVNSNYVTLAMQDLVPVFTSDGAMVPATGPGQWDQLRQAGRT